MNRIGDRDRQSAFACRELLHVLSAHVGACAQLIWLNANNGVTLLPSSVGLHVIERGTLCNAAR